VQVNINVVSAVSGAVDSEPDTALVPDQPPEAVQEVALLADHVRVLEKPAVTAVGSADSVTVGGPLTMTVALAVPEPPPPTQTNVKVVFAVSAALVSLPAVALVPDQPPDAEHVLALLLLHVNVTV
jgi:hypothetical protein